MTFTLDNSIPSLAVKHRQAKLREKLLAVGTGIVLIPGEAGSYSSENNYRRGTIVARKGDMYRVILETRARQNVHPCFWVPGDSLIRRSDKVDRVFKNAGLYSGHDNAHRNAPTRYSEVSGEWRHSK